MTITITSRNLTALDACGDQVALFKEKFGTKLNIESLADAVRIAAEIAHVFDFEWAADKMLRGESKAEYKRVKAQAFAVSLWDQSV